MSDLRGGHGREHRVVLIKVDPDLEGGGEAAGGAVSRGPRGCGPEVATHARHSSDCCRGGGGGLQGGDLKIVSIGHLAALDGIEGGHPGALGPNIVGLGRLNGGAAHPIRGLDSDGGDVGAVADGAVAPGPPDADVVILATQMGLGCGDRRG